MAETVKCPVCGFDVSATPDVAGMTVECPKCGAPFEMPGEAVPPAPVDETPAEVPDVWDLPEAPTADPRAPMPDEKQRQSRIAVVIAVVTLVGALSLLLALRWKKGGPRAEPGPEMTAMKGDVDVGGLRFRVTAADWREKSVGTVRQWVLDVQLSVANLKESPVTMPLVMLGDRWGRSLAADFGTPVFTARDDRVVTELKPGESVRGHVVFQPRFGEYCLIISADEGEARIRLKARTVPTAR